MIMNVRQILTELAEKWNAEFEEAKHGPPMYILAKLNFLMLYYPKPLFATVIITDSETHEIATIFTKKVKPSELEKFVNKWLLIALTGYL